MSIKKKLQRLFLFVFGKSLYSTTRIHFRVIKLFFGFHDLNSEVIDFHKSLLQNNDVILDIGSNLGVFTYHYAQVAPKGFVYSFEPMVETYSQQTRILGRLGVNNVRCFNVALSDSEGSFQIFVPVSNGITADSCASLSPFEEKPDLVYDTFTVPTVKLDSIIESEHINRIDFVKIDVEGAEFSVLKGGTRMLAHKPIIFLEVLQRHCERFGYHKEDIFRFLGCQGYKSFAYSTEDNKLVGVDGTTDASDVYFIHHERLSKLSLFIGSERARGSQN